MGAYYAPRSEIISYEEFRVVLAKEKDGGAGVQGIETTNSFRSRLRQGLVDYFDEEELRTLCFDMGLDYESLPAQGKAGKAREIVAYSERTNNIFHLAEQCRQLRPNGPWDEMPERLRGGFSATVVSSSVGSSPEMIKFVMPFKPREIEQALSSGMQQSLQRSGLAGDTLDPVKDLGARLYTALFDSRLQRMYSEALARADSVSRGLRLRLVITCEDLAPLPWEFLFDVSGRQDFVSLFVRTPVVRQVETELPPLDPFKPPLRVLFVMADVTGYLEVQKELDRLEAVRTALSGIEMEIVTIRDASRQAFLEALEREKYHVVHFSGTGIAWGAKSGTSFEEQSLVLMNSGGRKLSSDAGIAVNQLVSAEQLQQALAKQNELRLVYLSACKTDWLAWKLATSVPAVIGMRGDVSVDGCILFTEGMYTALLAGQPLDAAVSLGRERMNRQSPGVREWGLPTFYMQMANGALLDAGGPGPMAKGLSQPSSTFADQRPANEDRQRKVLEARIDRYQRAVQALQEEAARSGGQTSGMLDDEIKANQTELEKAKIALTNLG